MPNGPGARAVQLGRQEPAGAHHQGRRQLPAYAADPGRPSGAGRGQRQKRPNQPLGRDPGRATRLLESGGGHRGEERAHGLGNAGQGRGIQASRRARLSGQATIQ